MVVDYDLVIVGGTLEARQAAIAAAAQGARVALVEPEVDRVARSLQATYLSQVEVWQQWHHRLPTANWQSWQQWTASVSQQQAALRSPQSLLAQGIDYIESPGQFCQLPQLAFAVNRRLLTASAYLIATGFFTPLPPLPGLPPQIYTPETLAQLPEQPQRLAVLGATPAAWAIAQLFACLGTQVTLLLDDTWLKQPDLTLSHWLIAQLEAEGVEIAALAAVKQFTASETTDQICLGQSEVSVDQLIVASAPSLCSFDLGLEKIAVKQDGFGPITDDHLQTLHHRIFVLGSVLGRQGIRAIAPTEIALTIKNALLLPRFSLTRRAVPWSIMTAPAVASVGITPEQAKAWYGKDAWFFKQPLYQVAQAQLLNQTRGFCRLIVHRNGEILAGQIVSAQANELIQPIAQAIAEQQSIRAIARSPYLPQSLSAILVQTAQQWQTRHHSVGFWRRDWLENWFNWRRSR
ncbi:FAD-dependent oxidoreductase [Almyronema epifaneia]|uniref:FAD-dependent oxidoreductase n=1 Tax=Almyronema epifaneia S1 TaxID=2991925 RepID=A0ABW6IGF4_9CYAN